MSPITKYGLPIGVQVVFECIVPLTNVVSPHAGTCGGVLRVTSANLSGAMPAASAVAALQGVGLEADLVIDDGPSPGGVVSTVVRMDSGTPKILRMGAIAESEIRAMLA